MFPRYASDHAKVILTDTPVLGIVGPRQAGKTTLAKSIGGERAYFNLDDPGLRAAALTGKAGDGPIVAVVSGGNVDLGKFGELGRVRASRRCLLRQREAAPTIRPIDPADRSGHCAARRAFP